MSVRVLVVDDSNFYRRRLKDVFDGDAQIVLIGSASDGKEAIALTQSLRPDVITMDVNMPVLDGIAATRKIMSICPTPILMLSALTIEGAESTLSALDAGAVDFLPKEISSISANREEAFQIIREKVKIISRVRVMRRRSASSQTAKRTKNKPVLAAKTNRRYSLLTIGASTGGPVALQKVLTEIPASFRVPILLIQHMPANFTEAFAQRLNQQCDITVKHAEQGDTLMPGCAYLAPGGKQMVLEKKSGVITIKIEASPAGQNYQPCLDITFKSIAEHYGHDVLAVVLTGMGADGSEGAKKLRQNNAGIWVQNEKSCVVYGMPMVIAENGLAEKILDLSVIGSAIVKEIK